MQRHRVLVAFGIAWLSALLLSWWVYKKTSAPQSRQLVQAVAAAHDLPVGKRIVAADLRLVALDRRDLPQGALLKLSDAMERAVTAPISAKELVLERKLAARGSGEGLTALIEPGMRAISVQVNEISGVAGFIQPGARVDVLFTRTFSNGDAATTTILQNVKVIAYGRQLEPGGKPDSRGSAGQTVATLLVTQEQAEKMALAVQRGRIQLALRNPLDSDVTEETEPVRSAELGIEESEVDGRQRAGPGDFRPGIRRTPSGMGAQPTDGRIVVRVFRGSKVSEEIF